MEQELLDALGSLIRCKSVTPDSCGAIEFVGKKLSDLGFDSIYKEFGNDKYKVLNLYARYGIGRPNICFVGHVDVVPEIDKNLWDFDPFEMTVHNEKVYGRGAVDMKGAIACSLCAAKQFIMNSNKIGGSISFLLTSDEEGDAEFGIKEMCKIDALSEVDFFILGEPGSEQYVGDTIRIGRRGSLNFDLTIYGTAGHIAHPAKCLNPNSIMIRVLSELVNTKLDEGSRFFQRSNLEITSIDTGNSARNVIPAISTSKFNIRFNDRHEPNTLVERIDNIIKSCCSNYKLEHRCIANSFVQSDGEYIKKFQKYVTNIIGRNVTLTTGGGTSDARFLYKYAPIVECGLLNESAHKINEHTKINDLLDLYKIYYGALECFLG